MKNAVLPVYYHNLIFRISISFLSAFLIVMYGSRLSIFDALLMKAFYLSLAGSFLISLILVHAVHVATIVLDQKVAWHRNPLYRGLLQFVFGWIIPSIMAYLLAAIYFSAYGLNIHTETAYLIFDFPVIIIFLMVLNIYYLVRYLLLVFGLSLPAVFIALKYAMTGDKDKDKDPKRNVYFVSNQNRHTIVSDPTVQAGIFCCYKEYSAVFSLNGHESILTQSLKEIEDTISKNDFFRINRSTIINRAVISSYEPGTKRGTLNITLSFTLPARHIILREELLTVSQKRVSTFRKWVQELPKQAHS